MLSYVSDSFPNLELIMSKIEAIAKFRRPPGFFGRIANTELSREETQRPEKDNDSNHPKLIEPRIQLYLL